MPEDVAAEARSCSPWSVDMGVWTWECGQEAGAHPSPVRRMLAPATSLVLPVFVFFNDAYVLL